MKAYFWPRKVFTWRRGPHRKRQKRPWHGAFLTRFRNKNFEIQRNPYKQNFKKALNLRARVRKYYWAYIWRILRSLWSLFFLPKHYRKEVDRGNSHKCRSPTIFHVMFSVSMHIRVNLFKLRHCHFTTYF